METLLEKKYSGKYIVTTKGLQVVESTEKKAAAQRIAHQVAGRKIWQWSKLIGRYILLDA